MLAFYIHVLTGVSSLRTRFEDRTKGATAVEYGLMVALIAAVIIVAITALGTEIKGLFTSIVTAIPGGAA